MILFITSLHIFLCVILILIILLQPGKGGDVSAAFGGGGGGGAVFGPRGPASLLTRATTVVAVLFMFTSITLAMNSDKASRSASGDLESDIERFEREAAEATGLGAGAAAEPELFVPVQEESPATPQELKPSEQAPGGEPTE